MNKKPYYSDKNRNKTTPFNPKQITLKKGRLLLSALPLTSCANNPQSDFIETSANIFEIQTDAGGTFLIGTSQENLTVTGGAGNDLITTGDGDDVLNGGEGNDTLNGGNGNDRIDGGSGDDLLNGGAGDDILIAGGGSNNILNGGAGNDTLDGSGVLNNILIGGSGADTFLAGTVDYSSSAESLTINLANNTASGGDAEGDTFGTVAVIGSNFGDTITGYNIEGDLPFIRGNGGNDTLIGGIGIDTLYGGDGDDIINGFGNGDILYGNDGNDTLNGGDGNDNLHGGAGADVLIGGDGSDTVRYDGDYGSSINVNLATNTASDGDTFNSIESVVGSYLNDTIIGNDEQNSLRGFDGDDVIYGGGGIDNLRGGSGNDTLNGGDDDDTLIGDIGNDTLNGDDGDDHLYGWDGNDIINGGAGDDIIFGNAGADVLDGGDGIDSVRYHDSLAGVSINLAMNTASGGDAEGDIISNIENVYGSVYDDTIIGDDQDNYLSGGNFLGYPSGNDTLIGGGGNDTLFAGHGGQDTLDGGPGDDMFIIDKLIYFEDVEAPIDVFEGGSGIDTLYFRDYYPEPIEYDFDFSMIDASNIEILDFSHNATSSENDITLTLAGVLEVTDDNDELRIDGGSNVSVTSTGQSWVQGIDQNIDGETYNVFTSGGATLLIDEDIQQTIS